MRILILSALAFSAAIVPAANAKNLKVKVALEATKATYVVGERIELS